MRADTPASSEQEPHGAPLYGLYFLAIAFSLVGNLVIRVGARSGWLSPSGQVALAILAAGPLAVGAVMFWRLLRTELDEMLQRIVLEAMAFALVVYLPLAALYANLGTAGVRVPRLDPPDILMLPALLVAIGIIIGRRRYQ